MKNGSITEQISLQEKIFIREEENMEIGLYADVQIGKNDDLKQSITVENQKTRRETNNRQGL